MNLANYIQVEKEGISERTRDALRHIMKQGVCGGEDLVAHRERELQLPRAARERTVSGVSPIHSRNARKNELGSSKPSKNDTSA